jgi:hypothetical protein
MWACGTAAQAPVAYTPTLAAAADWDRRRRAPNNAGQVDGRQPAALYTRM